MKLILGGYCLIILIGTLLLALPVSTRGTGSTPVSDCFFTATSATCVTGLIRYDTFSHWTTFGQLVIISLIQIGGVGFMTVAILVMVLARRKISLSQRSLMQNSISAPQLGGIVRMTKFIALGTLTAELSGAVLLSIDFIPRFGLKKGIYFSVFHSISAFCNAGFDLMGGTTGEFSSLTGLAGNWYVNLVIMLLIFAGGLGFFVWHDIGSNRFHFKKLRLHSKMVLSISIALVFLGAGVFFLLERKQGMLAGMSLGEGLLASLFQSVTARTAGFNTTDYGNMTEAGIFVMICLMLIGGSTGSTAGGMKTTTFYVLCVSIFATFGRRKNIEAFGRRMEESITRTASCVFMTYLLLITGVTIIISAIEDMPLLTALFETVSAMATVGLTLGMTPSVGMVSKLLLALLMLCGRVGSITMLLAFSSEKRVINSRLPLEKVQVG
ncbi:MAG: Trk family potassium uptake protein [Roseburia sp.]|nr:Trk family potassium uptake protein [Roseburia sp.]